MENIMFKRKIYDKLLEWKRTRNGRTALLIEGARRIGKTTVVKEFAKNEYASFIVVDFSEMSDELEQIFLNNRNELNTFFDALQLYFKTKLEPRKSLIVFDEVQQFPKAREMIKQLVSDGRYDYIETGSLIRLKENVRDILIPSEEEKISMFPMDFEEFLWATGDTTTIPFIKKCFDACRPVGSLHRVIMRRFRTYLLVGGMPQAVAMYLDQENFEAADQAKRAILSLYVDDMHKADGFAKIIAIFNEIPAQLSKKSKRFMYSSLNKDARSRSYIEAFTWLEEAMIVNNCRSVVDPSFSLAFTADTNYLKCYLGDTGLLVTQAFRSKTFLDNQIYRDLLLDKLNINEGMIVENCIAQALRANGHSLYYYEVNNPENPSDDMEIDFVITEGNKLSPIEVKSANYKKHSSIDKFKKKFGKKIGTRYVLHTKDVKVEKDLVYLPLYMVMFL